PTTEQLILKLRKAAKSEKASSPEELQALLIEEVSTLLKALEPSPNMVGSRGKWSRQDNHDW
ncbi:MAG: hypothetical protein RLZZ406_1179, partial [Pseudomonadota bacterium]